MVQAVPEGNPEALYRSEPDEKAATGAFPKRKAFCLKHMCQLT